MQNYCVFSSYLKLVILKSSLVKSRPQAGQTLVSVCPYPILSDFFMWYSNILVTSTCECAQLWEYKSRVNDAWREPHPCTVRRAACRVMHGSDSEQLIHTLSVSRGGGGDWWCCHLVPGGQRGRCWSFFWSRCQPTCSVPWPSRKDCPVLPGCGWQKAGSR